MNDPIVEEVRRIRAKIAAEHGDDLHRIFETARSGKIHEGRHVVSFDAVRIEQSAVVQEEAPSSPIGPDSTTE